MCGNPEISFSLKIRIHEGNDPKYSDRQVWANNVDPDQTVPEGVV